MNPNTEHLNWLMGQLLYRSLELEAASLHKQGLEDLTITEIHVLEQSRAGGTMSEVASRLGITVGSLTVSIKTLEGKGYVQRVRSDQDRRCIQVTLTDKGLAADRIHQAYHEQLIESLIRGLSPNELGTAVRVLDNTLDYLVNAAQQA